MTAATVTFAVTCPGFCAVEMAQHVRELVDDENTFHRSKPYDEWVTSNGGHQIQVYAESFTSLIPDQSVGAVVVIDGSMSTGSVDMAELEAADARRLIAAVQLACDAVEEARS